MAAVVWWRHDEAAQIILKAKDNGTQTQPTSGTVASFNKHQYSLNDPASLWAVVNKGRVLPADYVPAGLTVPNINLSGPASSTNMRVRSEAASSLEKLAASASTNGIKLTLVSGYRSYATQSNVYNSYVATQGMAAADSFSARPGHSEHQTGLAADLGAASGQCQLEKCFGDTAEGKWLAANAYKYGFIIRYQKDKTNLTGYDYEPWHIRYVGAELATEMNKTGQTLEQFFELPNYVNYPVSSYQLKAGAV